jgi:hypothetical protein
VRPTVAQLRILDGWLPVRRMRMTWTVAAALAGYVTMIAVQLSLVAPLHGRAASAAPARPAALLSISNAGVCLLPVCLLAPSCVAGVGSTCLLPVAAPPPAQPAPPAAPAPVAAAPAPVAPQRPAPAAPAPVVRPVHHVSVVPAAPPPAAPPATPVIVPVARPVPAAAVPAAPVPVSGVPLPAPAVVATPPTGSPAPAGIPWGLYVLFAVVDLAATVALTMLIRRTAATRSRG